MTIRTAYAGLPHVHGFIDWLASELDSQTLFKHQYIDRRSGVRWSCASLHEAYLGYAWNHPGNQRLGFNPGTTAQSNDDALAALRGDLLAAGDDDERMLRATRDVMAWGGVSARNGKWLESNKDGLARKVQQVRTALLAKDPQAAVLRAGSLRFNSGMTKVYSLLCPDFVIYDSRVAAGLGLLVVRYCMAKGLNQVPEGLNFPWAGAKEGENTTEPKNRNPSVGGLRFKRLRSGGHHARWNMNASWVLSQVAAHVACAESPLRAGKTPAQTLRALEQALFMVGYDLGEVTIR